MNKTSPEVLARQLRIHPARGLEAVMKAKLIGAILRAANAQGFTHAELARRSGIPRSAVTGILSGSLQRVTLDRVLRLADAAQLKAELRIKEAV